TRTLRHNFVSIEKQSRVGTHRWWKWIWDEIRHQFHTWLHFECHLRAPTHDASSPARKDLVCSRFCSNRVNTTNLKAFPVQVWLHLTFAVNLNSDIAVSYERVVSSQRKRGVQGSINTPDAHNIIPRVKCHSSCPGCCPSIGLESLAVYLK